MSRFHMVHKGLGLRGIGGRYSPSTRALLKSRQPAENMIEIGSSAINFTLSEVDGRSNTTFVGSSAINFTLSEVDGRSNTTFVEILICI